MRISLGMIFESGRKIDFSSPDFEMLVDDTNRARFIELMSSYGIGVNEDVSDMIVDDDEETGTTYMEMKMN